MNPFASQTTNTIPLPFDPPHTATITRLSGRQIEAAQDAHRGTIASGSARSWAATFRRALEKGASDPDVLKAINDPLTGYDRFVLVRAGLRAWSYPQAITPVVVKVAGQPDVTTDAIEDLDDEAVDYLAREILRLTKPGLFLTPEERADEKKSAPATSTGP